MFFINNLLLNIFGNLFGVITLVAFDLKPKYRKFAIPGLACLMIYLCMTFPFFKISGMIFDLRVIPLILTTLYGGRRAGLFVSIYIIVIRICIGFGIGVYHTALAAIPVIVLSILLYYRFKNSGKIGRSLIATSLAFFNFLCVTAITALLSHTMSKKMFFLIGIDCMIHTFTMVVTIILIETIRENRIMRQEVQRIERLNVLGEMAASFAHEIRNPLTVTKGFIQLLEDVVPENKQHYLEISVGELNRAESIIKDYLAFAKPQVDRYEILSVDEQITHIVNVMSPFAVSNSVEIIHDVEETLFILVDSQKLFQVMMNITKNGIEAMPTGGELHIRSYKKNEFAVIEISDNGVGMNTVELNRLGNPFYSTKEKGTGLGLMVCYSVVEAMNGTIQVQSTKNKGTCFSLIFPIVS